MNTQRTSAAVWLILAVAIVIDIAGRRVMPDPVRFDTLVGGVTAVLFLIFDQRVCLNCGHEGKTFMFLLWRWL
jgi:hypothetical protein